ncbi:neutral zinc metallopeptidase [Propionimicrobium lymphophilum]|uniref:neutral zinc metallopeptidase n=1 Tax=Propionimicrobium lymphophilum TaxID=33012 RepID=UPI0023F19B67|nr:neutral zinc metallopeptidase [Propionimicrobium lymphophilum]
MSSRNPWATFPSGSAGGRRRRVSTQSWPLPTQQRGRSRKGSNPFAKLLRWIGTALFIIYTFLNLVGMLTDGDVSSDSRIQEHYNNESYQIPQADSRPPALPSPATYEQAKSFLVDNPIYDQQVFSPVRCDINPIDLSRASARQIEQHLNDYTSCLMRVFGPAIEGAGFTAVRPPVTVYDGTIYTACGEMPEYNAAYCAADQQVYFAKRLADIFPREYLDVPFVAESVLAHEFGHAIQGRTGILISERAYEQQLSELDALEFSRRTEVQADCWAGQFNSSVNDSIGIGASDQRRLASFFSTLGDDALTGDPNAVGNHGRGESRQRWYTTGTQETSMGACNTFVAPSNTVK